MTLHEAIRDVLAQHPEGLSAQEISSEIAARQSYERKDGAAAKASQVSARARKYPHLFTRYEGRILLNSAIERPDVVWDFKLTSSIDGHVPKDFGIYAIRLRSGSHLPDPFAEVARSSTSELLYVGRAKRQTLLKRFLGNDLRGKGNSSFFRSIGAVLGFTPPSGSLADKANRYNYRFTPEDRQAIVAWLNENTEVSWVTLPAKKIRDFELAVIATDQPLLNLTGNPAALSELKAIRRHCQAIAIGQKGSDTSSTVA